MKVNFMEILAAACSQAENVEDMDEYLNDTLSDVAPYDLVFKNRKIGGKQ